MKIRVTAIILNKYAVGPQLLIQLNLIRTYANKPISAHDNRDEDKILCNESSRNKTNQEEIIIIRKNNKQQTVISYI